jgi:hypothetical protein
MASQAATLDAPLGLAREDAGRQNRAANTG